MKIGMVAPYEITDPKSWSGTPFSVYKALTQRLKHNITTVNLSQFHTQLNKKMNLLKHLDVRESLKSHSLKSSLGPSVMNPLNSSLLDNYCKKNEFDVLFQFGGFMPSQNTPKYYIYTDSSHDMGLDFYKEQGKLPWGSEFYSIKDLQAAADYVRPIYQQAEGIFCMSDYLAQSLINTTGVDKNKVHVVYAGANWHGEEVPKTTNPKRIEGKEEIHLLLTGVTYIGKGVDIAIEAVKLLNAQGNKKYILHICGLKETIDEAEGIVNHGFVNKKALIEYLKLCDLFVLPSRFDCFGIGFVEAMTFGLPCIGRNICAMPEIIDEGINGELVRDDNPKKLADLISKICEDPQLYESYSTNALEKSKVFDWNVVADKMLDIIKNE